MTVIRMFVVTLLRAKACCCSNSQTVSFRIYAEEMDLEAKWHVHLHCREPHARLETRLCRIKRLASVRMVGLLSIGPKGKGKPVTLK